MNSKNKYIKELEKKIRRLPSEERNAAIGFYKEYLIDVGVDTYDEAVQKIGTPSKVAAKIVSEYYLKDKSGQSPKVKRNPWKMIGIVLAAAFAIPIGLPLVLILLLAVLLLIFAIGLVLLSFFMVAIMLLIMGLVGIILSVPLMSVHLLTGVFILGAGLIVGGLGIYAFQFSQFTAKKSYQLMVFIGRKLVQRGGGQQYAS